MVTISTLGSILSMRILTDIHQLMMLQEQQCRRISLASPTTWGMNYKNMKRIFPH